MLQDVNLSRRGFLQHTASAAGCLIIAAYVNFPKSGFAATPNDPPMPNAFIKISPDNKVTVILKHLDKGQGVATGLTSIVADELDADWAQMATEFAPANAQLYNNLAFGPIQGTGGSSSIANSWTQLRMAGAAARQMLVSAAADTWAVPADTITINKGVLSRAGGSAKLTFGDLAAKAATQTVPEKVSLKDPKNWIYIGKPVPRLDSVIKTTGAARFALDIKRPGMLTAVVARPPLFGGKVKSFDPSGTMKVKGVVEIFEVPSGIAVIAKDTYAALEGRKALKIDWDDTGAEKRSSDEIFADYRTLAAQQGLKVAQRGDADQALKGAAKVIEAEFQFPYLAHAPMEPVNATIELTSDGGAEIWAGSQFQTIEQMTAAKILGTTPEKINIHTVWAGGSFGRRATPTADYIAEAAYIAKASKTKAPIHLVWTREDDITGGYYRPLTLHRVKLGFDSKGELEGWQHQIVNQSFIDGTAMGGMMRKDGVDPLAVEGIADSGYAINHFSLSWHQAKSPVTTLWWRSVGHSHTAQVMETMIDTAATEAGRDPLAFRLERLKESPRLANVFKFAAEKGNYGEKLPPGRGRGIAGHESFKTFVAMVAEVSVEAGEVKVERVVAAVDCGIPVNPDVIKAQVEGAIGFAMSAALKGQITLDNGRVEQSNFDGYAPLRISDMPEVEVYIVASTAEPSGIGEPGVPPVAPAISNAVFAATGKRLYSLPFDFTALKGA